MKTEKPVSDIAFSASVKAAQTERGSRAAYARMEQKGGWKSEIDGELREFIAERDSFYLGTASAEGQPYIQHRGGPRGFLKVLDDRTLAFADFSGNAQYISIGNADENPRATLFLMDYVHRRRIKVWGTVEYVEGDAELAEKVHDASYRARVERVVLFRVEAWDVNCPQHITPRYTEQELAPMIEHYQRRIRELEAEVHQLRGDVEPGGAAAEAPDTKGS